MPVHEIRYTAWKGELKPTWQRLFAIPKYSLVSVFTKWLVTLVFGIGLMQLLTYTGVIILITNPLVREAFNMNLAALPKLEPHDILRRFYLAQMVVVLLAVLMAAPRMISKEVAHRALPMIYSRPIGRLGYILGKCLGLFALLSFMTWFQGIIIFVIMTVNYPSDHYFHVNFQTYSLPLFLRALAAGLAISVCATLTSLACSSATKNARYAGVLFLVLLFAGAFVSIVIRENFLESFPLIGLGHILGFLVEGMLSIDQNAPRDLSWGYYPEASFFSLITGALIWCILSFGFMWWKLRPVDIYKE